MEARRLWCRPDERPALSRNEVDVWRIPLDVPEARVRELLCLLSATEREEAERRMEGPYRRRFIVAHGALRSILAAYEGIGPAELVLGRWPGGKPHLLTGSVPSPHSFSLSHSHELALCAVALQQAVGVDVEWIRPVAAMEEIVDRYLSRREAAALRALPEERTLHRFLTIWTRKEACSKALGEGVSTQWRRFSVPLEAGTGARTLTVAGDDGPAANLEVCGLDVGPGYLAAVATAGNCRRLRRWQWA